MFYAVQHMDEHLLGQSPLMTSSDWYYNLWEFDRLSYQWRIDEHGLTALGVQTENQFGGKLKVWLSETRSAQLDLRRGHIRTPLDWNLLSTLGRSDTLRNVADPAPIPTVETHCPELASLAQGDAASLKELIVTVGRLARGAHLQVGLEVISGRMLVRTSRGVSAVDSPTEATLWVHAGDFGETLQGRRMFNESHVTELVERTLRHERLSQMDCQRPSGDVSVKLTPLITHMLLDHYLFPMLTRKETKREQMGAQNTLRGQQQVIAPWLSIELDTLRPYHISSFRFDSRGIPGQRLFVTERGCLTARLGTEPGGSSPPTPLPNNSQSLVLHDLRRQTVDDGPRVLVTAIDGLQQHGTDGEFALGLRTAFLMNENRPIGRVRGLIRGNWWNLLRDPETKVGHEGGLNSLTVRCEFL